MAKPVGSLPAIIDPTPEMLDAFQGGFAQQLHLRYQARFKQPHELTPRQRESAEQAGLRAMLGAMPPEAANLIAAAPALLASLKALRDECSGTPRPWVLVDLLTDATEAIDKAEATHA